MALSFLIYKFLYNLESKGRSRLPEEEVPKRMGPPWTWDDIIVEIKKCVPFLDF